ncbi:MAG: cytochrome c class I [Bacteroidetes bacterium]|nr:cytochrome c class I [Bacteroidota bacterium]
MKKTFLLLCLAAFIYSCGGSGDKGNSGSSGTTASSNPDADKGLALVAKSDCLGCHEISKLKIGPPYNEVAKKYAPTDANINLLVEKIQKGGSGNWGTVPMLGHPNISKEDATLMVKYVLSLKDEK